MSLIQDIQEVADKWCPDYAMDESLQSRSIRGMLEANACVLTLQSLLAGNEPIRPLDSFKPFQIKA